MSNYTEIRRALSNHQPFTGNSMSARREYNGDYVVYSYVTEIARVLAGGGKVINERKYSVTTSRHQNLVAANL